MGYDIRIEYEVYISIHVILIVIVVFIFVSSEHDLIEKANIGNTMGLMGDDSGISPRCVRGDFMNIVWV